MLRACCTPPSFVALPPFAHAPYLSVTTGLLCEADAEVVGGFDVCSPLMFRRGFRMQEVHIRYRTFACSSPATTVTGGGLATRASTGAALRFPGVTSPQEF